MSVSGSTTGASKVSNFGSTGLWSVNIRPGRSISIKPGHSLYLRSASLTATAKQPDSDNPEGTELYLTYSPSLNEPSIRVLLATLRVFYTEQIKLSLEFQQGAEYRFTVVGRNDIDIVGFFEDAEDDHRPPDTVHIHGLDDIRIIETTTQSMVQKRRYDDD